MRRRHAVALREVVLVVEQAPGSLDRFRATHRVEVTARALNLEELFPVLVAEKRS